MSRFGHNYRKEIAFDEAGNYSEGIYCKHCEELTEVNVIDCSFDHEFGIEHKYEVVCEKCEGTDFVKANKVEECVGCQKYFEEDEMDFDYYNEHFGTTGDFICPKCVKAGKGPQIIANDLVKIYAQETQELA